MLWCGVLIFQGQYNISYKRITIKMSTYIANERGHSSAVGSVSDFPENSVSKMYGSTLLALREVGVKFPEKRFT